MAVLEEPTFCTFAEYVALERESDTKHELINGQLYAMAGGSIEHGRLAMRMARALGNALGKRPCEVLSSDVRVRVQETGLVTYPDLSVVCGRIEADPQDKHTITNPIVLVEVLSDSTSQYDRGEKLARYRRIPSLRDYLLVDQKKAWIEHYARNDDGSWTLRDVRPPEKVRLTNGAEIDVAEVYENLLGPTSTPGDSGAEEPDGGV